MAKIKVGTMIDEALWRRFRSECVLRGLKTTEVLESLVRSQYEAWQKKDRKSR